MKFNHSKIKQFRKERNLTQKEFLRRIYTEQGGLDITTVTLQSWEKGKTSPGANELALLAMFFNKPVKAFFEEVK